METFEISLEFKLDPKCRAPNSKIKDLLMRHADDYPSVVREFSKFTENFLKIPEKAEWQSPEPRWVNHFIPGLDAIALYSFVALKNPKYYVEVGSGNSTKFVRRAIQDHSLRTKIISIDPTPRAEIDSICDQIIRRPFQDLTLKDDLPSLESSDIWFMDGSHQCFQNTDVTVFFTETLWDLPKSMLIGVHDIFFPHDYPAEWFKRYYSEQYLLASILMADQGNRITPVLPSSFAHSLSLEHLGSVWRNFSDQVESTGCAFWFKVTQ